MYIREYASARSQAHTRRQASTANPLGKLALTMAAFAIVSCSQPSETENPEPDDSHEDAGTYGNGGEHDGAPVAHDGGGRIELSDAQIAELGVVVGRSDRGPLESFTEFPGEVRFDEALLAYVSPPVAGILRRVEAAEGDHVEIGATLAVLDSRELADAKSTYLAAIARLDLVQSEFDRQESLRGRGIATEQRFIEARQALEDARVALRNAAQQLDALGVDEEARAAIAQTDAGQFSRFELTAPIDGIVIERHAIRGEYVAAGDVEPTFVIADTSTVWVDAAIYPDDLRWIEAGARAQITIAGERAPIAANVSFVAPRLSESTRTGLARLIVENENGLLRPGMFVTVQIASSLNVDALRVPAASIQSIEGEDVVFVPDDGGFETRAVRLGRRGAAFIEVLDGLDEGVEIVVAGAFALKSELQRGEFGDGHAH